jgi:hypothetical protein
MRKRRRASPGGLACRVQTCPVRDRWTMIAGGPQVPSGTTESLPRKAAKISRPWRDFARVRASRPAMNRWAIFGRPTGTIEPVAPAAGVRDALPEEIESSPLPHWWASHQWHHFRGSATARGTLLVTLSPTHLVTLSLQSGQAGRLPLRRLTARRFSARSSGPAGRDAPA